MLLNTVILPEALEAPAESGQYSGLICSSRISLLRDLAKNCLVLVDRQGELRSEIKCVIDRWPPKFKPQVQVLLKELLKSNRIVEVGRVHNPPATCATATCKIGVEVARSAAPSCAVIVEGHECRTCVLGQANPRHAVTANEFHASRFEEERLEAAGGYTLRDGQWNQREFENKVLRPVFAHAKHVKVIDRNIGRTATGAGVKPSYRNTLLWLLKVFKEASPTRTVGSFEVYCGLYTSTGPEPNAMSAEQVRTALSALRRLEDEMKFADIPVRVVVKKETPGKEMPHGRYLFTDQVELLVERGFDLLWTDAKMRGARLRPGRDPRPVKDVSITHCPDPERIEECVLVLPNLS